MQWSFPFIAASSHTRIEADADNTGLGHYLQNCPTNFDEAYDTGAPAEYFCRGCNKRGEHYFTLCPQNTNYDSLFQLRERAKAKEGQERQRQRDLAATFGVPSRVKHQKVERLKFEDDSMDTDDSETVTITKSQTSDNFNFSSDFKNTKMASEGRLDLINSYNSYRKVEQFPQEQDPETDEKMGLSPAHDWKQLEEQHYNTTKSEYDSDTDPVELPQPKPPRANDEEHILVEDMRLDKSQWNKVQPGQKYSPRALYWIRKGFLSTEIINKRARRPTALELWDRDDEDRARSQLKLQMEVENNDFQDSSKGGVISDASVPHRR